MCVYPTAHIEHVPKQCLWLLYTYNRHSEENDVGPDPRQVQNDVINQHS